VPENNQSGGRESGGSTKEDRDQERTFHDGKNQAVYPLQPTQVVLASVGEEKRANARGEIRP
jgi:hypothetical protein